MGSPTLSAPGLDGEDTWRATAPRGVCRGRGVGRTLTRAVSSAEPRALLSSWGCPLPGPDLLEPWKAPPPWSPPAPLFPGPYAAVSPDTRVGASPSLSRR